MSTIFAKGLIPAITPFMTPTYASWLPKSVRSVITRGRRTAIRFPARIIFYNYYGVKLNIYLFSFSSELREARSQKKNGQYGQQFRFTIRCWQQRSGQSQPPSSMHNRSPSWLTHNLQRIMFQK